MGLGVGVLTDADHPAGCHSPKPLNPDLPDDQSSACRRDYGFFALFVRHGLWDAQRTFSTNDLLASERVPMVNAAPVWIGEYPVAGGSRH